jgi:prephenate dehydratase
MDFHTVAFQGESGAYSEQAAIEFHSHQILTLPCATFEDVFTSVSSRAADRGIIPVENSLAGSIHRNYDLMLRHELHITGEYYLRVSHCLLALPGTRQDEIRRVHSHPQALAQCEANLKKLGVETIPEADTAGSARQLAQHPDREAAVLASRRAGEVYGLQVLAENMEDNPENYTRFLVLSCDPDQDSRAQNGLYKTSVVFTLENKPGALFKALSVFALRDIDLTKIESRPIKGRPWEYLFYIDFAGNAESQVCRRALDHLAELAPYLRLLGSYPRHQYQD